jgi:hypothetical protein
VVSFVVIAGGDCLQVIESKALTGKVFERNELERTAGK